MFKKWIIHIGYAIKAFQSCLCREQLLRIQCVKQCGHGKSCLKILFGECPRAHGGYKGKHTFKRVIQ